MFLLFGLSAFGVLYGGYLLMTTRKRHQKQMIINQHQPEKKRTFRSVKRYFSLGLTAGLFFIAGWFLIGGMAWGVLFLVFGVLFFVLSQKNQSKKSLRQVEEQLEEVLYRGTNVLRGGGGIYQLLEFWASEKTPERLRSYFRQADQSVKELGTPPIEALQKVAATASGLSDLGMMTTALAEAQKNGADLAEVVEMFAADLRNRRLLQNEIEAKTTQGIMTANFLLAIGIGVPALLKVFSLFTQNPTLAGATNFSIQVLTAGCYLLMGVGYLWIRRLTQV